jgi:hypothetical protein
VISRIVVAISGAVVAVSRCMLTIVSRLLSNQGLLVSLHLSLVAI